jgi:acyl-CoA hydrolase
MRVQAMYRERRLEPADAVRVVRDGETIVVPIGVGEPPALLRALSERRRDLRGVTVFQLLPLRRVEYFDPDTTEHVRHCSAFLGGPNRPGVNEGWAAYYPAHFSEIPELIRRGLLSSEVVFAQASAMDEHGFFALGLSADYTMAAIARARAVVLEVNPQVPFCFGDCHVHVSQVAALVEGGESLFELPPATDRAGGAGDRRVRRRVDP